MTTNNASGKPLTVDQAIAQLTALSQRGQGESQLAIPVDLGFATIGGTPRVPLMSISAGIDWDARQVFLHAPERLAATGPEFQALKGKLHAMEQQISKLYTALNLGTGSDAARVSTALAVITTVKRAAPRAASAAVPSATEEDPISYTDTERTFLVAKLAERGVDYCVDANESRSAGDKALRVACRSKGVTLPSALAVQKLFGVSFESLQGDAWQIRRYTIDFMESYIAGRVGPSPVARNPTEEATPEAKLLADRTRAYLQRRKIPRV